MKLLWVFFAALLVAMPHTMQGGSVAGGIISYRAIDSATYEVTTLVYVQCDTTGFVSGDSLFVSWQGGGIIANMAPTGTRDVTGTFDKCSVGSNCKGPGNYKLGYTEYSYKCTVTVATNACKITFAYKGGQRLSAISTGPANTDFYLQAQLNKCIGINNSVHTTLPPQFIATVGLDVIMSAGFIDTVDGDSVGYLMEAPLSAAGTAVSYNGSWSKNYPIIYLGFPYPNITFPAGFHFDSVTSQIGFRPTKQNETTVFVIEAIEYRKRNGAMVEIGRTRLEHVLNIIAYPNNKPPRIRMPFGNAVCVGSQISISVSTEDVDGADTTHLIWNEGIKNASFVTSKNGKHENGTFYWVPTEEDVRN